MLTVPHVGVSLHRACSQYLSSDFEKRNGPRIVTSSDRILCQVRASRVAAMAMIAIILCVACCAALPLEPAEGRGSVLTALSRVAAQTFWRATKTPEGFYLLESMSTGGYLG